MNQCNGNDYIGLHKFFLAHGAGIGERRIIRPFHLRMMRGIVRWMAGKLPGGKLNLSIGVPPGHTKTYLAHDTINYSMGLWPDCQWLYVSYAAELAIEQTQKIKDTLNSEWYRGIFPHVGEFIGPNYKFRNRHRGLVYGAGLDGTITGFRGGQKRNHFSGGILIDDPIKAAEANSEAVRKKTWSNYTQTILSRKNRDDTPQVMIAQRLHPEDLTGMLKKYYSDIWYFLEIPGVDEEEQTTIWPETYSYASAMRLKEVDPFAYYSQYQQSPVYPGGSLIKDEWWKYYDETEDQIKRRCDALIITADTAFSEKTSADDSVLQLWGMTSTECYLIDQIRGKFQYETLLEKVIQFWDKHSDRGHDGKRPTVDKMYIEAKASGLSLLGQAKTFRKHGINAFPWDAAKFLKEGSTLDKVARVNQAKLSIYAGKVLLPSDPDIQWVDGFIAECSAFNAEMTQTCDDAVDAATMAILLWQALGEGRM